MEKSIDFSLKLRSLFSYLHLTKNVKTKCSLYQVIVVASDNGSPNFKTSTSTLSVTIKDVNDNVPLFEQSFYEANLSEDEVDGKCFLTVILILLQ